MERRCRPSRRSVHLHPASLSPRTRSTYSAKGIIPYASRRESTFASVLKREQFQTFPWCRPSRVECQKSEVFLRQRGSGPATRRSAGARTPPPQQPSSLTARLNLCLMIGMLEDQECGRCSVATDHASPRQPYLEMISRSRVTLMACFRLCSSQSSMSSCRNSIFVSPITEVVWKTKRIASADTTVRWIVIEVASVNWAPWCSAPSARSGGIQAAGSRLSPSNAAV